MLFLLVSNQGGWNPGPLASACPPHKVTQQLQASQESSSVSTQTLAVIDWDPQQHQIEADQNNTTRAQKTRMSLELKSTKLDQKLHTN